MTWRIVVRPDVGMDLTRAARWYDRRQSGLGDQFVEEVMEVLEALEVDPFLRSRRHPTKNIRWRYPNRFPYRVVYEVREGDGIVIVAAVIHAARHERHWKRRV